MARAIDILDGVVGAGVFSTQLDGKEVLYNTITKVALPLTTPNTTLLLGRPRARGSVGGVVSAPGPSKPARTSYVDMYVAVWALLCVGQISTH
jgi:hypothetical protein